MINNRPDLQRYVLTQPLAPEEMDRICQLIDGVYFDYGSIELGENVYYIVDFRKWTEIKPQHRTLIELMMSR